MKNGFAERASDRSPGSDSQHAEVALPDVNPAYVARIERERDSAVAAEATATECYLAVCKQRDELLMQLDAVARVLGHSLDSSSERCDLALGIARAAIAKMTTATEDPK